MTLMRFDCNCMLGRWSTAGPVLATVDDLLTRMDALGIARALVRHTLGAYYDPAYGNDVLSRELAGQDRLVPCWAAVPTASGEMGPLDQWLQRLAANGVRAVCLYPHSYGHSLSEWQCGELLTPLAERHYLLLVEAGETDFDQVHWLCSAYPDLQVVLLNTGYRALRPLMALATACPNLCFDLSTNAIFRSIETLVVHCGAERLLFGTGEPRNDGSGIRAALDYSEGPAEDVAAMAGRNLERLLSEVRI